MILLITPPMVQCNTPYPATPVLAGFLKSHGFDVTQADLSLEVALHLFSSECVEDALERAEILNEPSPQLECFIDEGDAYLATIEMVIAFLQGKNPEAAWLIARRGYLPEGKHFRELDPTNDESDEILLESAFGNMGIQDKAKLFASLYLDDLASYFTEIFDPDFGFAKYAEHLAVTAPSFDPILKRLTADTPSYIDALIDSYTQALIEKHQPDYVGITTPFPGTVYGAFRVAACVRRHAPNTHLVLGGGYVNSELRDLDDPRVFDYFDTICFDEGFDPWLGILGKQPAQRVMTRAGYIPAAPTKHTPYKVPISDYTGLDFSRYFSMLETANPMHRLWSDGRWLKVQLSNGCYWHKCAFCDVALDYIGCFAPPNPQQAVNALLQMKAETGISAFHFTDEALAPALIDKICDELIERNAQLVWWGNIRFDTGFTAERIEKMMYAGCISVSAGLECANDRLLKLMNKGITLQTAERICQDLSEQGILVHTYLMYGFPTQTVDETLRALDFVRHLYANGLIQSSYWHRFALTVHSPIAQNPNNFGIQLKPHTHPTHHFACNEIEYTEKQAKNLKLLGKTLEIANYNFTHQIGLDIPSKEWYKMVQHRT